MTDVHHDEPSEQVRWLTPDEQALWRDWIQVTYRMTRVISSELTTSDLNYAEFALLVRLTDPDVPDGTLVMGELGRRLEWEASRLSHQITRMVKRGLVTKATLPSDRRSATVTITDAGRQAIVEAAPGHVMTVRREFIDRLSVEDQRTLSRIIHQLVEDAPGE